MTAPALPNTIVLIRGRDAWYARYCGPHTDQIRDLFGTNTLPTPFLPSTPADVLLAEIQARNVDNGVTVILGTPIA